MILITILGVFSSAQGASGSKVSQLIFHGLSMLCSLHPSTVTVKVYVQQSKAKTYRGFQMFSMNLKK
jgi:hypothetical protein